jgi:hypothetical protein
MLRFFRQIRQRLFTQNKFSKYLLYAVGEILLVVIGILIALQIDNWNEQRQEEERIKSQLVNLMRDFKGDRETLQYVRGFHAFRVHVAMYLLNKYGIKEKAITYAEAGPLPELDSTGLYAGPVPDSIDRAFITRGFSWLLRKYPTRPIKDAFDEFKSTGLFAEFENQELKNNIRDYYDNYAFTFPLEDRGESNSTTRLKNSFASEGYSYLDVAALENPIEELLSYPAHVAYIKNIIDESTYRSNRSSDLIRGLDQLILSIENEIDNYSSN